ncbi:MAG: pirin family protein [Deltaproteobacteria bacterium]|nr:pirin family protein [Deltaproteobacteria bacterium]
MITVRKSEARGLTDIGWLRSYHSFSFDTYYDPLFMHFRKLRVINEDTVMPGLGFSAHPHSDMEIISYVIKGELQHRDSMGNGSIIRPGEIQIMTAGTGLTHSEFNPDNREAVHFLQIWILPEEKGLPPGYEQKNYLSMLKENDLTLIASREGRDESVVIHQDVDLYTSRLSEKKSIHIAIREGRFLWIQLIKGELAVAGEKLFAGDACSLRDRKKVKVRAMKDCEFLLFDLP